MTIDKGARVEFVGEVEQGWTVEKGTHGTVERVVQAVSTEGPRTGFDVLWDGQSDVSFVSWALYHEGNLKVIESVHE